MKKELISLVLIICFIFSCEEVFYVDDISNETVPLLSPTDNSILDSETVQFHWGSIEGADKYHLQIATPSFISSTQIVKDTTLESLGYELHLTPSLYQWRIKGINSQYNTPYQTSSFEIISLNSDAIVELISPPEQFITNESEHLLKWEAIDYANSYTIEVWEPDTSGDLVQELTSDTNEIILTFEDGRYIWQVQANSQFTKTNYSSRSILVDLTAPSTPQLLTPENELTTIYKAIDFKWDRDEITGSEEIDSLYLFKDASLKELVFKNEVQNSTYQETLVPGTYYWYVNSFDEAGNKGERSEVFSFEIVEGIAQRTIELLTPVNNIVTNEPTQLFTWQKLDFVDEYHIAILLRDTETEVQTITTTEAEKEVYLQDGNYFWRVNGINAIEETAYSERTILIDTKAPNTPVLLQPQHESTSELNIVHFEFNRELLEGSQEIDSLFVFDDSNLNNPILQKQLADFDFYQELELGSYYWYVQSYDKAGNISDRSEVFNFSIIENINELPVNLLSPVDDFNTNQQRIAFSWEPVDGANSYQFSIEDTVSQLEIVNTDTELTTVEDVLEDGSYIWKVKAKNAINETDFFERNLLVDTQKPNRPTLINPINEHIQSERIVHFEFNRDLLEGSQEIDSLFVFDDSNLNNLILQKQLADFDFYQELELGSYYWYIQSYDSAGNTSDRSEVFNLSIESGFSEKEIQLILPEDGFITNENTHTFEWSALENATEYQFQLVTFETETIVTNISLPITTKTLVLEDGKYYWRVRAKNNQNYTNYFANVIEIDTKAPEKPTLTLPVHNSTLSNTTVEFSWQLSQNNGSNETSTIRIYRDAALTDLYKTKETDTSTAILDITHGTYYWVVEIRDEAGNISELSESSSFTIE